MCTSKWSGPGPGRKRRHQSGVSMLELIMFIIIIGIAVAGVMKVMTMSNQNSVDPQLRAQALAIADGLLEEVMLARFTYCDPQDQAADTATSTADCSTMLENVGPESGNTRPYDNVNDYVSAFGVEQAIAISDVNGVLVNDMAPYSAFLTITPEPLGVGATAISSSAAPAGMEVLHIRTRVHYASQDIVLDAYRTRHAPDYTP